MCQYPLAWLPTQQVQVRRDTTPMAVTIGPTGTPQLHTDEPEDQVRRPLGLRVTMLPAGQPFSYEDHGHWLGCVVTPVSGTVMHVFTKRL